MAAKRTRGRIPSDDPKAEVGDFSRPARGDVRTELMRIALHLADTKESVMGWFERVYEEHGERSAIRQYLGGLPRDRAEREAVRDTAEVLGVRFT